MDAGRVHADEEEIGDLTVGASIDKQVQNLAFAGCEAELVGAGLGSSERDSASPMTILARRLECLDCF